MPNNNTLVGEAVPGYVPGPAPVESDAVAAGSSVNQGAVPDGTEIMVGAVLVVAYVTLVVLRRGGFRGLLAI